VRSSGLSRPSFQIHLRIEYRHERDLPKGFISETLGSLVRRVRSCSKIGTMLSSSSGVTSAAFRRGTEFETSRRKSGHCCGQGRNTRGPSHTPAETIADRPALTQPCSLQYVCVDRRSAGSEIACPQCTPAHLRKRHIISTPEIGRVDAQRAKGVLPRASSRRATPLRLRDSNRKTRSEPCRNAFQATAQPPRS
jgi:hypothetical protein